MACWGQRSQWGPCTESPGTHRESSHHGSSLPLSLTALPLDFTLALFKGWVPLSDPPPPQVVSTGVQADPQALTPAYPLPGMGLGQVTLPLQP